MDENGEAQILQSFIQFQAIKHGDHLLKALPAIAGSFDSSQHHPHNQRLNQQHHNHLNQQHHNHLNQQQHHLHQSHQHHTARATILQPKDEMILKEEFMEQMDAIETDPLASDPDENSNPSVDGSISSVNHIFLEKLHHIQHLQTLDQLNKSKRIQIRRDLLSENLGVTLDRPTAASIHVMTEKSPMGQQLVGTPVRVIKCVGQQKRKRSNSKESPSALELQPKSKDGHPLCAVCGEKAGKHSYYGGQVCASCRAFFRRAVQSGMNTSFACVNKGKTCDITVATRKNCQFCRYEKCLQSGMRPNWILSEEERVRRFQGRKKKGNDPVRNSSPLHNNPGGPLPTDSCDDPDSPAAPQDLTNTGGRLDLSNGNGSLPMPSSTPSMQSKPLTLEELRSIEMLGSTIAKCCTGRTDDLEPGLVTSLLQSTLQGTRLSRDTMDRVASALNVRTKFAIALLEDYRDLTEHDQMNLLTSNIPLLHRLRQALTVANNRSLTLSKLVELFIGASRVRVAESQLPCDLSSNVHTKSNSRSIDYMHILFGEKKDLPISLDLVDKISQVIDLEDHTSLILVILIVTFNSDFVNLEQREKVEAIQLKYVCLLQRYLSSPSSLHHQQQPLDLAVNKTAAVGSSNAASVLSSRRRTTHKNLLDYLMIPSILRQMQDITNENLYF